MAYNCVSRDLKVGKQKAFNAFLDALKNWKLQAQQANRNPNMRIYAIILFKGIAWIQNYFAGNVTILNRC